MWLATPSTKETYKEIPVHLEDVDIEMLHHISVSQLWKKVAQIERKAEGGSASRPTGEGHHGGCAACRHDPGS